MYCWAGQRTHGEGDCFQAGWPGWSDRLAAPSWVSDQDCQPHLSASVFVSDSAGTVCRAEHEDTMAHPRGLTLCSRGSTVALLLPGWLAGSWLLLDEEGNEM